MGSDLNYLIDAVLTLRIEEKFQNDHGSLKRPVIFTTTSTHTRNVRMNMSLRLTPGRTPGNPDAPSVAIAAPAPALNPIAPRTGTVINAAVLRMTS